MIEHIRKKFASLRQKRDLTVGSISKNIWILAIPLIVTNLLESAFNLVDMFWVGKLGAPALAAVSMSGIIIMLVFFLLIGICTGTIALIARFVGAKEDALAGSAAMQSIYVGTFFSIILGVIGYILTPNILKILGADPLVLQLGIPYMRVTFACIFVMIYALFMSAILQGAGDTVLPMLVFGLAGLINLILDPFLIFGIGPFPKMGVVGAAWATVIGRGISSLIALDILFMGRSHIKIKFQPPDFSIIKKILMIGVPASGQYMLRGLMGVMMISIVAGFGTFAIAAYGVGLRLTMLVMMPGFAFAAAAQTLVGQNLGAENPERSSKSAWTAFYYYAFFMLFMTVLFFFFSTPLMKIFSQDNNVISIGAEQLKIISLSFVFMAYALVFGRALNGAGDSFSPMIIIFLSLFVVQLPLSYFLANKTPLGLDGIWYAMFLSTFLQGVITVLWFQTGRWKRKKI